MPVDSKFIRRTLMHDEKVEAEGIFSPMYTVSAYFWFLFCIALGFVLHYLALRYLRQVTLIPIWFMTAVGLAAFFSMMLKLWTTEIFLTNRRIIYKRGLFLINVDEVDVEQLASDKVHQSLLGRMFGFGSLHVRCVEADDLWLPEIVHPYSFRNALERVKRQYRENYLMAGRLYRHGSSGDRT